MVQIVVVPKRATFYAEMGKGLLRDGDKHRLAFELTAPLYIDDRRTEVRLSTKEKLGEIRGTAVIHSGAIPEDEKLRVETVHLGEISYSAEDKSDDFPSPAMYFVRVWVATAYFNELLAAARLGKMPRSFGFEVEGDGIKYGWEPDGSGKEWDVEKYPRVPIISFAFDLPLAIEPAPPASSDDDIDKSKSDASMLPPTRAQFTELAARISAFAIPAWIMVAALVYIAYRFAK